MDSMIKNQFTRENVYETVYGNLSKVLVIGNSARTKYNNNFSLDETSKYTDIFIKSVDPLLIIKDVIKKNPVMVNIVNPDFDGKQEYLYDDFLATRTNFAQAVKKELFPIIKNSIIYTSRVTIIRDTNFKININTLITFPLITAPLCVNPKCVNENYLNFADHCNTIETIESIFQTCIITGHNVIVFNNLGCKYNKIPFDDLVDIINLSILKYGTKFSEIYFTIPIFDSFDEQQYKFFLNKIIKPNEL